MTAYTQAAIDIAAMARIGGVEVDYSFLQEDKALCGLEGRSGRICAHKCAVEERPRLILNKFLIVLASLTAHKQRGVVVWHRHHTQYLTRLRLDGYHSTALAYHQRLGILLQLDVEAQTQVAARYRLDVVGTVFVATLYSASGVAHKYLHALDPAQMLLIAFLYAEVTGIVAGRVIGVAVYIVAVHLAYIAEHIGGCRCLVLTQDTLLDEETRKAVELLLQASVVFH